ncbi:hypothetical protein OG416_36865 (plasmid) [Streptomyces longwoodensis]|uniref:hypothetical protein n=1 Tax=Streptomyces longwoodensis TaxID=68231 RepID=UPI002F907332|nr:hypothetical protein OG416_36865 [Streptomyces longwoodensis]
MAALYAWMRNRCPVAVQFVANYVTTAVTALGMGGDRKAEWAAVCGLSLAAYGLSVGTR